MKLPRDLTGRQLVKALERMENCITRHTGSHARMFYERIGDQRYVTVPLHDPLRVGTLAAILTDVASYHKLTRDELVLKLFGKN